MGQVRSFDYIAPDDCFRHIAEIRFDDLSAS